MKSTRELLGFDDKWLIIIGIPFVSLIISSVLYADALENNSPYFIRKCYPHSLLYTTGFWLIFRAIILLVRRQQFIARSIPGRILAEVILVVLAFFLLKPLFFRLVNFISPIDQEMYHPNEIIEIFSSLLFSFFIMAIYEIVYVYRQLEKSNLEKEQLGRAQLENQLEGLKSQIQPHFLFNSLNTLAGLIPMNQARAIKYVQKLSQVFRYVLEINDEPLISLEKELHFLQSYIHLIKERFGENIIIDLDIDESHHDQMIVPLSLQLLFENAIKHNVLTRTQPLRIKIYINEKGKLTVENNLQPKPQQGTHTQIGLKNIQRRYAFFVEENIDIIKSLDSFIVSIPLISNRGITAS
ncbi:MAG: histidine kinase [Saprospiraceae bacterium]|nr:histidine kinase [Saprospiraceae bacterium]